ncbi:Ribonuclease J [uncultured archaeon]|nr:Ribonuclease J [uncultured archaeon]
MELKEIKQLLEANGPKDKITKVDLEGPKVIVYTDDMPYFVDNHNVVRELASVLKKRIIIRSSPDSRMSQPEAEKLIRGIIPAEAEIDEVVFDETFGEVRIEAEKLGLVIGKRGSTLEDITKQTRWVPKLLRKPPIQSDIVRSMRKTLLENSEERQKILKSVGKKIYRKPEHECDWLRLTPLGGAGQVGRSCFLLQTPESNVFLDCGINVAAQGTDKFPDLRAANIALTELDAVVLSHAHIDHCGFIPYLYHYGYEGPVYCTEPTRDIASLLLLDAVEIGEWENEQLPYTHVDVRTFIKHCITLDYGEVADITPDIHLTFYNAGHILGSAISHLHIGEGLHNLVYTGDLKFGDTRLLEPADYNFPRVETLLIECTYGGRHDIAPKRFEAEKAFVDIITKTLGRGGKVIIPVFSVGRSQEVMMVLENAARYDNFNVPIYLDGMIWEATAIHTIYPEFLKRPIKHRVFNGQNPFLMDAFTKVNPKQRSEIINGPPCIILATSGMMTGGPSVEYFKQFAPDEKNSLIFVGYQSEGSLGRRLQNGMREYLTHENGRTKSIPVNMEVNTIEGFSGHADRRQLLGYKKKIHPKPNRVLLVHGEQTKLQQYSQAVREMFRIETTAPRNLDTMRLV